MTLLNRARLRLLFRNGNGVMSVFRQVLDRQQEIEAASYDSRTGLLAVSAARMALDEMPVEPSAFDQACKVLDRLEALAKVQQNNPGEHSTGAATIGSILRIAKTQLRIC